MSPLLFILLYAATVWVELNIVFPRIISIVANMGTELSFYLKMLLPGKLFPILVYVPFALLALVRMVNIHKKPSFGYVLCMHTYGILVAAIIFMVMINAIKVLEIKL